MLKKCAGILHGKLLDHVRNRPVCRVLQQVLVLMEQGAHDVELLDNASIHLWIHQERTDFERECPGGCTGEKPSPDVAQRRVGLGQGVDICSVIRRVRGLSAGQS